MNSLNMDMTLGMHLLKVTIKLDALNLDMSFGPLSLRVGDL